MKICLLLSMSVLFLAGGVTDAAATGNVDVDQPTWSQQVAPIVHENCVSCHRPGQIGPMSLRTYDEARPWAKSIGRHVEAGLMPPWHAESEHLTFANDRRLSGAERETIVRWAQAGAPAGDLTQAPTAPEFPDTNWRLGEPDLVVTLDQVTVPGGAPDQFHDLVGRVALPDDRWLRAVEILPGNSRVVHHVIVVAIKGFDVDPQDGWLGAWAAGTDPMVFAEGTGRFLPKGSNIAADMHYHAADTEETDVTRIGLHFADDSEIDRALANVWIINQDFKIPAGAERHEVRASRTFWQDGQILGLIPHMHYRGKDFTFLAHRPDGTTETLMTVPRWDFNWQTVYELETPVDVAAGTRIECIAHYDNSSGNPANPDPTIDVTFGDESYDEMMIGFVDFVAKEGRWPKTPQEIRTEKLSALAAKYPGKVWAVSGRKPEERGEPHAYAPLVLSREGGDGEFWVIWNDQLEATRVHTVVWDGDRFEAKLASPYGEFGFRGQIEGESISTEIVLPGDRTSAWDGELAKR